MLAYGEPLYVPRGADDAALAEASETIRRRLLAAEEEASRLPFPPLFITRLMLMRLHFVNATWKDFHLIFAKKLW